MLIKTKWTSSNFLPTVFSPQGKRIDLVVLLKQTMRGSVNNLHVFLDSAAFCEDRTSQKHR